ncbi:unnamed protein product [Miscanthus lutarioriparius]|uniref:Complex 1 LYR protein domain-containing protein n=1 Tax=Miscanthus lutarioriparius TaxID=422564 RepID=A0A811RHJ1_9POAL|nr:unnamed protein product [Miscanthus lutarioriparius]
MPSLQKALPPELADNVLRLYRECLRRAKYIGHQKHNTELLVTMVRQQFKKNMHETDPEKIQKMKDDFTIFQYFIMVEAYLMKLFLAMQCCKGPYQSYSV